MAPVAIGITAGLLGATLATRLLESTLYEVSPTDPSTFAVVALLLCAVALTASVRPARAALSRQVRPCRHPWTPP